LKLLLSLVKCHHGKLWRRAGNKIVSDSYDFSGGQETKVASDHQGLEPKTLSVVAGFAASAAASIGREKREEKGDDSRTVAVRPMKV